MQTISFLIVSPAPPGGAADALPCRPMRRLALSFAASLAHAPAVAWRGIFMGLPPADRMMLGILGKTFGKSPMEPYPSSI